MSTIVTITYSDPVAGVFQIVESLLLNEDSKYFYLESGEYRKKYCLNVTSKIIDEED